MINLLPPEIKSQQHYARMNNTLRRYVILAIILGALLSAVLMTGNVFATIFTKELDKQLVEQNQKVAKYKDIEQKANDINGQLKKLTSVLDKTTRYSEVLKDIANHLPPDSRLASFNISGDPKEPLTMTVSATSEKTALQVQPNLETMDRFSFVDIQEFRDLGTHYEVDMALTFADTEAAQR